MAPFDTAARIQSDTSEADSFIPLPAEGLNSLEAWKQRVSASLAALDEQQPAWDRNQKLYELQAAAGLSKDHIITPDAYTYTEQKKAVFLASISERVTVEAKREGAETAAPVMEAIINHKLGASDNGCVNFYAAVDEILSDLICASGIGALYTYYQPTIDGTKDVPTGRMIPDPSFVPNPLHAAAAAAGLMAAPQAPMVPETMTVPNIISERYACERISPSDLLLPKEFKGSVFDRATWIGRRFEVDLEVGRRYFRLPATFEGSGNAKPRGINLGDKSRESSRKVVTGTEIFYTAHVYDPNVKNPELQRVLVIVDGLSEPVKHQDSPYQIQNPDGSLSGMQGYPITATALRYVSDKAYVKSDVGNLVTVVTGKSRHRTSQILTQERSIPQRLADKSRLGDAGLAKLERAVPHSVIAVDALGPEDGDIVKPISQAHYPQENQLLQGDLNVDAAMVMGMSFNQTGAGNPGNRSAQEVATVNQGSGTRQEKEIQKFKNFAEVVIGKLASLFQMFADEEDVVKIAGQGGQKKWTTWDKNTIAGSFAFTISTDEAQRQKARAEFLQAYNLLAPSPNINRLELDTQAVQRFGMDPERLMVKPQEPPAPKPDMPKLSISIGEKELSPLNPSFGIYIELLRASGVAISDEAVLLAQKAALSPASAVPGGSVAGVTEGQPGGVAPLGAPQPQAQPNGTGTVPEAARLSKHAEDFTGNPEGVPVDVAA